MKLKDAGELYIEENEKLQSVNENLNILVQIFSGDHIAPFPPSTVTIRIDILRSIAVQLADYKKHLEYVLNKEI